MMKEIKKMLENSDEDILFMEKQFQRFEALTGKRMELIRVIMHRHPGSIRELAEFLHRDVKNVFDDLRLLDNVGVIKFVRIGRRKRPVIRRKIIVISLE